MSFLSARTTLINAHVFEDIMTVTFDENIFNTLDQRDILEEVLYTIALSIKSNYNINETVFQVNEKEITKTVLKSLE